LAHPTTSGTASATLIGRLPELQYSEFREAKLTQGRVTRALMAHSWTEAAPMLVRAEGQAVCPRLESPYAILSYWPEN
jgi:hypothetical protein